MKIYSNRLTEADVRDAFRMARTRHGADIYIEDIGTWQPRDYSNGVEVHGQSISGSKRTNRGTGSRAASWDDWGYVIAYLYDIDPHARIGFYDSLADFIAKVHRYPRKGSELPFLSIVEGWST
jgi:hypothetical protein